MVKLFCRELKPSLGDNLYVHSFDTVSSIIVPSSRDLRSICSSTQELFDAMDNKEAGAKNDESRFPHGKPPDLSSYRSFAEEYSVTPTQRTPLTCGFSFLILFALIPSSNSMVHWPFHSSTLVHAYLCSCLLRSAPLVQRQQSSTSSAFVLSLEERLLLTNRHCVAHASCIDTHS